jgi:hypothetical protein
MPILQMRVGRGWNGVPMTMHDDMVLAVPRSGGTRNIPVVHRSDELSCRALTGQGASHPSSDEFK